MPGTRADIILQFVWTTKRREAMILAEGRDALYNCIAGQVAADGCRALAIGGTEDHIHVLVSMRTEVAPADLAQRMKGISSHFCKDKLGWAGFYWQEGYGVFSVSRAHVRRVTAYIRQQEAHHARGDLWTSCEMGEVDGEDEAGT
ncbi:MAG: IS200/IS605 family transposase [Armatimonadetes bacterium]|nr:IS200/IS605 family transposase [Armatimonadota bacterium]